ncbi:SDR family oxidoreductase [Sphingomonas mali]|uniref:SDR family oxidoreductase n=1 Tax=Sphingomonas mali TaxID=40682 RepID=UPI00082DF9F9|nr:SDR family oxidoreductase [Sphingomonas mali]
MGKVRRYAVVGGTSGMGFALARLLVERGDRVVIGGRDQARLAEAAARLGDRAEARVVDSGRESSREAFFDGLSDLAGLFTPGASYSTPMFRDGEAGAVKALFDAKFWGQYWTVHAALSALAPDAGVVLMAGTASIRPTGSSAYAACNAAIEGLGRALARELAPLRVNTLSPGMIDSELWRNRPDEIRDPMVALWRERTLTGRPGTVAEAAGAAAFLLDNGNITGSTIYLDGGWTFR